ncbi:Glycoside hydrolase 2 (Mannanase, beta-galactosidase), partial [Coemansia sp. RSA 2131]
MECSNDISAMTDLAKVADLVILTIDASFGFEMETFEFLNLLQTHGMPKVMGVLTHLDGFKDNKRLKVVKKNFKHRFWTEVYDGAKLFYLSGVENGRYLDREILNLSRFVSIVKLRPLAWRSTHPYMLADRVQDLTDPEALAANPKANRTVALYGYLRGTHMKGHDRVHIPGAGDYQLDQTEKLADPCPIPDKERKRLDERHKLIYAPMSEVNGVMYDKDAVYIDIRKSAHEEKAEEGEGERMLSELQKVDAISDRLASQQFSLFSGAKPVTADSVRRPAMFDEAVGGRGDADSDSDADLSDSTADEHESRAISLDNGSDSEDDILQRVDASDNDDSDNDGDASGSQSTARLAPIHTGVKRVNLMELVYGTTEDGSLASSVDTDDCIKPVSAGGEIDESKLRKFFITNPGDSDDEEGSADEAEDDAGDFEDLEAESGSGGEKSGSGSDDGASGSDDDESEEEENEFGLPADKMKKLKSKFDRVYDSDDEDGEKKDFYQQQKDVLQKYVDDTRTEMDELATINYRWAGEYVKVVIEDMPYEFMQGFNPTLPIVLGGIPNEEGLSLITLRIKRHR